MSQLDSYPTNDPDETEFPIGFANGHEPWSAQSTDPQIGPSYADLYEEYEGLLPAGKYPEIRGLLIGQVDWVSDEELDVLVPVHLDGTTAEELESFLGGLKQIGKALGQAAPGALSGAASGAMTGMAFGPYGALIGAGIGAVAGAAPTLMSGSGQTAQPQPRPQVAPQPRPPVAAQARPQPPRSHAAPAPRPQAQPQVVPQAQWPRLPVPAYVQGPTGLPLVQQAPAPAATQQGAAIGQALQQVLALLADPRIQQSLAALGSQRR